jgi:glycosyltransferase involved in cell wall biosynthesis
MDAGSGVSFVITVYNKRPYLSAVVAGLIAQRGDFPREFIFVDDGSTDGSRDELEALTAGWADVRIFSQPNLGPSIATNRGIAAARYPLIKLVDGDDVLLPDGTALLREAMQRYSDVVLAFGETESCASAADAQARLQTPPPASAAELGRLDAMPAFLRNCDLGPSACLLRAEAVRQVGGCDERVFVQDYSLFLRLAANGPFLRIAAPVALTASGPRQHLDDGGPQVLHDINLALYYFLSEHDVPVNVVRSTVRRGLKRAWHWARRREGARLFDPSLRRLLASYLPFAGSPEALRESCAAFSVSRPVRRPSSAGYGASGRTPAQGQACS